ncbi:527_t:CDS:2, partial [Dentiscutata erythropus]
MNLVQEKMIEILEDGEACPETENSKEFAKEKFEDWVENYYDRQEPENTSLVGEKKRVLLIIKLQEERKLSTRDLVTEVNLECLESGISFKAMDGSRIALISMFIDSKDFDKFVCDRAVSVGVNISSLNKILARVNDNVSMLLKIDQDSLDIINI